MQVNPAFLQFFNRAAGLSTLLYPSGGSGGLAFSVHILPAKGIQSVTFQVDAQNLTGSDVTKQFTWSLANSQQAGLTANYGSGSLPLQFTGPWAVFHLLDKGRVEREGSVERLDYPLEIANTPIQVGGVPLVVHLELSGPNANLLMPGGLSGMRCVSTVVH